MRWAKGIFFAIAVLVAPLSSAAEEGACIRAEDASLTFDPNDPPICPRPTSESAPLTDSRQHDHMAVSLANCAGLFDAATLIFPEVAIGADLVGADEYFEAAKARRERPSLAELEELRRGSREQYIIDLQDPAMSGGSIIPHTFMHCGSAYRDATGE